MTDRRECLFNALQQCKRLASMLEAAAVLLRHDGHPAVGCDRALANYRAFLEKNRAPGERAIPRSD